jgi:hypothetical protein
MLQHEMFGFYIIFRFLHVVFDDSHVAASAF